MMAWQASHISKPATPVLALPPAGNCYDNDPFNCAFYAAEGFCDPASDL